MSNQHLLINEINGYFEVFNNQIIRDKTAGFNDKSTYAEDILIPILDAVFDTSLKNENATTINRKAIDLSDTKKRIAFQVTSSPDTTEIVRKLKLFVNDKELRESFDRLFFIIITNEKIKLSDKNKKEVKDLWSDFEPDINIVSLPGLYGQIRFLPFEKIKKIHEYLEVQFRIVVNERHSSSAKVGLIKLDSLYWNWAGKLKNSIDYLTRLNTHPDIICSAIKNGYTSKPIFRSRSPNNLIAEVQRKMDEFSQTEDNSNLLITILGGSGDGKSTGMFDLAFENHLSFDTYLLLNPNGLSVLQSTDKKGLVLINGIKGHVFENNEVINTYYEHLNVKFKNGFILVIAEQISIWDANESDIKDIIGGFPDSLSVEITHSDKALEHVLQTLEKVFCTTSAHKAAIIEARSQLNFFDKKFNIADQIIHCLQFLEKNEYFRDYGIIPDWKAWENLTENSTVDTKMLFSRVAFANLYNLDYPVDLLPNNQEAFEKLVSSNESYPLLVEDSEFPGIIGLRLRHNKIAQWYFENFPAQTAFAKTYYNSLFKNVNNLAIVRLFRKFQQNPRFQEDFGLSDFDCVKILENHIEYAKQSGENDQWRKSYFEVAKKYFWKLPDGKGEAYKLLDEADASDSFFAETLRAKFLLSDKKLDEASERIKTLKTKFPTDAFVLKLEEEFGMRSFLTSTTKTAQFAIEQFESGAISENVLLKIFSFFSKNKNFVEAYQIIKALSERNTSINLPAEYIGKFLMVFDARRLYDESENFISTSNCRESIDIDIMSLVARNDLARKDYMRAYESVLKSFRNFPFYINNLQNISRLLSEQRYSFSDEDLIYLKDTLGLAIDEDKIIESQLPRFYKLYCDICYLLKDYSYTIQAEAKLQEACRRFVENDHLKIALANHYLNFFEITSDEAIDRINLIYNEIRQRNLPEYILSRSLFLLKTRRHSQAKELLSTIASNQKYSGTVTYRYIFSEYALGNYDEVIKVIIEKYYRRGVYSDYEINAICCQSVLNHSKSNVQLITLFEQFEKYFKEIETVSDFQGIYFLKYCHLISSRSFDDNPEAFRKFQKALYTKCISVQNRGLIEATAKFLIRAGHWTNTYRILEQFRDNKYTFKYFEKNRYLSFACFAGRIVALDEILINSETSSKRKAFLRTPAIIKNEVSLELTEKFWVSIKENGNNFRRGIIFLYVLWRDSYLQKNKEAKPLFNLLVKAVSEFNGYKYSHAMGAMTKTTKGYFMLQSGKSVYWHKDDDLFEKIKDDKKRNVYASISFKDQAFLLERGFVINGEKDSYGWSHFASWISKIPELKQYLDESQLTFNGTFDMKLFKTKKTRVNK